MWFIVIAFDTIILLSLHLGLEAAGAIDTLELAAYKDIGDSLNRITIHISH